MIYERGLLLECLNRNLNRPKDQIVNKNSLINVYNALEAPQLEEGFDDIFTLVSAIK